MKSKILLVFIFIVFLNSNLSAQNSLFDNDSLRFKIGQMMVYGFLGGIIPIHIQDDIINYNVGGFILRQFMNLRYGHDLARTLIRDLQSNSQVPLFITIDQEPGLYGHLNANNGFSNTPSAYQLGQLTDEPTTRGVADLFTTWFLDLGLNTNFAPVVDLRIEPNNIIGDRSFGINPDTVIQNAHWFIDEFRQDNLFTTIKHFPGHGSATGDTHAGFINVTNTWQDIELLPFKSLIDSNLVDIVMTAHIYNARFDSIYPATLSYNTITTLLRDSLNYDGVIISDEMFMGAIYQNYTIEDAITFAINAGVDILLYNREIDYLGTQARMAPLFVNHVEARVLDSTIARSRIEESYRRIMRLKNNINTSIGDDVYFSNVPDKFSLVNFPNPFNNSTNLQYTLPYNSDITIIIYDLLGRKIIEFNKENQNAGKHSLKFDASKLTSGIYIYQLKTEKFIISNKMLLVK